MHCHLLPGVDDGFRSTGKSLEALKTLEAKGVTKMILTPHFMKEYPDNEREPIMKAFEDFKAEAAKVSKIELRLAAEYMLDAEFMKHYKQGFLCLDKAGTHVLCETSYLMYEHGITEMLYDIMCEGYQPVIAHPERYQYANKANYLRWKRGNRSTSIFDGRRGYECKRRMLCSYQCIFKTAMKASCGTSTLPTAFMRFLPSFCFSSSLRFLVMSPP